MNAARFFPGIIVLVLGICFAEVNGQAISWSKVKGPYAGAIQLLSVDPSGYVFAAASNSGIYRSTDEGGSWQPTGLNLEYGVSTLISDSVDDIYAGNISQGLYETSDRGKSWQKMSLTGGAQSAAIISGGRICVGGRQTVSISNDMGKTWSVSTVTTDHVEILSIAEDGSGNIYAGLQAINPITSPPYGGGVYISSDSGRTWKFYGLSLTTILSIVESSSGKIFVTSGYAIYSAAPKDSNWSNDGGGLSSSANILSLQRDRLGEPVAVTDKGLFAYNDSTDSWINVAAGVSLASITTAFYDPDGFSYAGTDQDGIYFLDNTSSTWVQCGVYSDSIMSLGISSSGNLFAGTADGVFEEGSDPGTWLRVSDGLQRAAVYQINTSKYGRILSGVLVASTSAGLFYLPNGGNHWNPLVEQWTYSFAQTPDTDYASVAGGILKSTDGSGVFWNSIQTIGLPLTNIYCLALDSGGDLFAGTQYSGVFESTDGGTFWTQTDINSPIIFYSVKAMEIDNKGRIFAGTDTSGAYYSDDSGVNWNSISSIGGKSVTSFLLDHPSRYFVGTSDRGVFVSSDRGLTWQSANDGITDSDVTSLIFDHPGYLYAATASGIFKSTNIVAGIHENAGVPSSFSLSQNYPNPFNPSTTIGYELSAKSYVTIKVYDVLGRVVKTLVDEVKKPGRYEVRFDGIGLSSGIYFYRLVSNNYTETKKMVLIK